MRQKRRQGSCRVFTDSSLMLMAGKNKTKSNPYPFDVMSNAIIRGYMLAIIVALPLLMDNTKYSAITIFKFRTFTTFFCIAAVLVLGSYILYEATKVEAPARLTKDKIFRPTFFADAALLIYWALMIISTLTAQNTELAFVGMTPRNNGFLVQTMYTATYFMLAHGFIPKVRDALVFVWGGAVFGAACLAHFFGWDMYNIASVNGAEYGGPFWTTTKYRFLGPMGNVNLGSYVLAIAVIIAAGLYIQNVAPKKDKYNISTIVCFAVILFAELNINTDAGLVALAAAIVLIPPVLCSSLDKLCRTIHVYAVAAGVAFLDQLVVEVWLREEEFGGMCKLLLLATIGLAAAGAVLTVFKDKLGNSFLGKAKPSSYRIACSVLMGVAVVAALGGALYITAPDPTPAGAVAGAIEIVDKYEYKEKTDTIIHELGQILRGNFDDDFGHNRLFTWKRALRLVEINPLFGIGPDNFKTVFAAFFYEEARDQFPSSGGGVDKAHNEFLDVLVDNGILGFAAYMAFFGLLLWFAFRNIDSKNKVFAPVFGIAVVGYMAHAFFGYQLPIQSPCMWVMIGVGAAMINAEEGQKTIDY